MDNPKEKAKELIGKFYKFSRQDSSGFLTSNEDMYIKNAKQCAITCVDEIQKALEEYDERNNTHELQNMESDFRYWEEVRKELELL